MPLSDLVSIVARYERLLAILAGFSLVAFVLTIMTVSWVIARIPEDYYATDKRHPLPWRHHHPLIRFLFLLVKNLVGLVFLLMGVAMLVLPGQGLLTILAGVMLMDFPGKFRCQRWLLQRRLLRRTVNWLRRRHGRPPLQPGR